MCITNNVQHLHTSVGVLNHVESLGWLIANVCGCANHVERNENFAIEILLKM